MKRKDSEHWWERDPAWLPATETREPEDRRCEWLSRGLLALAALITLALIWLTRGPG